MSICFARRQSIPLNWSAKPPGKETYHYLHVVLWPLGLGSPYFQGARTHCMKIFWKR